MQLGEENHVEQCLHEGEGRGSDVWRCSCPAVLQYHKIVLPVLQPSFEPQEDWIV